MSEFRRRVHEGPITYSDEEDAKGAAMNFSGIDNNNVDMTRPASSESKRRSRAPSSVMADGWEIVRGLRNWYIDHNDASGPWPTEAVARMWNRMRLVLVVAGLLAGLYIICCYVLVPLLHARNTEQYKTRCAKFLRDNPKRCGYEVYHVLCMRMDIGANALVAREPLEIPKLWQEHTPHVDNYIKFYVGLHTRGVIEPLTAVDLRHPLCPDESVLKHIVPSGVALQDEADKWYFLSGDEMVCLHEIDMLADDMQWTCPTPAVATTPKSGKSAPSSRHRS
jgi:hypothetical protein